jgi:hypothetical protein
LVYSVVLRAQESAPKSLISLKTSHFSCPTISSCFTPGNRIRQIVNHILQAKHAILVQEAYAFSSKYITLELNEYLFVTSSL